MSETFQNHHLIPNPEPPCYRCEHCGAEITITDYPNGVVHRGPNVCPGAAATLTDLGEGIVIKLERECARYDGKTGLWCLALMDIAARQMGYPPGLDDVLRKRGWRPDPCRDCYVRGI